MSRSTTTLLEKVTSPVDLHAFTEAELAQLADEMRHELIRVVSLRSAHFASNLGVVELCLALHLEFDFRTDRLIWDTGHQIYPHKLITGRSDRLETIRSRGGLMGYPNPHESDYDLFMTGHAGSSVSTVLGLRAGDIRIGQPDRHSVAVIGDGAFPSGIVFEALNNAAGLRPDKFLVVLNDNQMSICPRVGGLAQYFDELRINTASLAVNRQLTRSIQRLPLIGRTADRFFGHLKDAVKASLHGGSMLFEEMGFAYIGPIDGHDLKTLRWYLHQVKAMPGPVLLHVLTNKGHGFEPAVNDPVKYHAPAPFVHDQNDGSVIPIGSGPKSRAYTDVMSQAIHNALGRDPKAVVLTAAMCEGNKLQRVRDDYPDQFFDTGICEGHAVAFAAGMAKSGCRPIVDIYSTFLQRSFDQIFQEVSLQNLPVTFALDRAGLVGNDGPTHHGSFDLAYLRIFPNMVVMAPGDEADLEPMLQFSLSFDGPCAIRYPKTKAERIDREPAPIELGQAEVIDWETDGVILCLGAHLVLCREVVERLREQYGLRVGLVNARFAKPIDQSLIVKAAEECGFVLTVEEGCRDGGFGAAVLETLADAGVNSAHVRRLGIPDRYVLHADRKEQLAEIGLDLDGITRAAVDLARAVGHPVAVHDPTASAPASA